MRRQTQRQDDYLAAAGFWSEAQRQERSIIVRGPCLYFLFVTLEVAWVSTSMLDHLLAITPAIGSR